MKLPIRVIEADWLEEDKVAFLPNRKPGESDIMYAERSAIVRLKDELALFPPKFPDRIIDVEIY